MAWDILPIFTETPQYDGIYPVKVKDPISPIFTIPDPPTTAAHPGVKEFGESTISVPAESFAPMFMTPLFVKVPQSFCPYVTFKIPPPKIFNTPLSPIWYVPPHVLPTASEPVRSYSSPSGESGRARENFGETKTAAAKDAKRKKKQISAFIII